MRQPHAVAEWKWNMWHVVMTNETHREMKRRMEAEHSMEMNEAVRHAQGRHESGAKAA